MDEKGWGAARVGIAETVGELIERDHELRVVLDGLADARAGRARLILLEGETGTGKTHLARTFAASAEADAAVAWGRVWEDEGAPPYWPVTQIVLSLIDTFDEIEATPAFARAAGPLGRIVPELTKFGPSDRGVARAPGDRFAVFRGVVDLIRDLARLRPVVAIVEDVHSADHDTLLLLAFLAQSLGRDRVLLLATCDSAHGRPELAQILPHATRVDLGPLSEQGVAELYSSVTGEAASGALASALYEASEGNPLFVREAVRLLQREGDLRRPDHSLGFKVPQGAAAVLRRRLTPLSKDAIEVLSIAAVLGRDFDADVVADVARLDRRDVLDRLDESFRQGIVREVSTLGRFAFSHVLFREVLYEDLVMSDRMRLHQAVLEVFERRYGDDPNEHLDELAHHSFKAAQAADRVKTLDYMLRAAKRAASTTAYDKASRLYERALKVGELGGLSRAKRHEITAALASVAGRPDELEPVPETNTFTRSGEYWNISYEGNHLQLKDTKGLRYIAELLKNPGRTLHALELIGLVEASTRADASVGRRGDQPASVVDGGDLGDTLDPSAKAAYRHRLTDLREEIAEAQAFNDSERAARAEAEMEAILAQLAESLGFGGRQRKPEAERARTSVTKAIKSALARLERDDPRLGRHLDATIRTGILCSYVPDPRSDPGWKL